MTWTINKSLPLSGRFFRKDTMNLYLAPLAGYTDPCYRSIVDRFQPKGMVTEMVSMRALYYKDKKTLKMLTPPQEKNTILQIFGDDPQIMETCVREYLNHLPGFVAFEINMGCPAPKIVKSRSGSGLLLDQDRAQEIIQRVKEAANRPVGVKTRKGFHDDELGMDLALRAQEAGADYLVIHGRTRDMYYEGKSDWDFIHRLAKNVKIPVYGNGDIFTIQEARDRLASKDLAGVYIGRGAIGNPWIFQGIQPSLEERIQVMMDHLDKALVYYGQRQGILEMRKHLLAYMKGLESCKEVKLALVQAKTREEVKEILVKYQEDRMQSWHFPLYWL